MINTAAITYGAYSRRLVSDSSGSPVPGLAGGSDGVADGEDFPVGVGVPAASDVPAWTCTELPAGTAASAEEFAAGVA